MKRNGLAWILGLLLILPALGQAQMGEYSVSGMVQNALTGKPVRNALVSLERVRGPGEPEMSQTKSTISGHGGEFRFDGLPEGHYRFLAGKPDFMPEDWYPQNPGTLAIPRSPADGLVRLNLTPFGAIEGKLVNQFGEPLENVVVVISSIGSWDGERATNEIGKPWTNNLGLFGLTRVLPGKYYVKAVGRRGGTETHVGADTMHYAPWESFTPVYFGGAPDIASAAPIQVEFGSVVQADFHVDMQPAFRIRGKLERYTPPESVSFELLRGNERGEPNRAVLDGATGQFEILDVLPGAYTLRATQGKTRGEVSVIVADTNLDGVSVTLSPAVTVNGSMHYLGSEAGPPAASGLPVRYRKACAVSLREHRRLDSEFSGQAGDDGRFTIEDVFPGEYRVVFECRGGYPLSASFGDTNLLTNAVVTISSGVLPPIEIEFKPGGGTLKVKFADKVPPLGVVLLVPSFAASAGPVLLVTWQQPGEVAFANLAPGDYLVYVLSQFEDAEYRNPAFLESLSGGTTVHIEDGKTAEVAIAGISK